MLSSESALTLEPVIEAVRESLESRDWALSGLQKTTSHEFEGKWAGETSRSAYLFFHKDRLDGTSIDVFLDETSRGLRGNLALVFPGPDLGEMDAVDSVLGSVSEAVRETMLTGYRTPVTLRVRLADPADDPSAAASEIRVKLQIPRTAFEAGSGALAALASAAANSFESLADHEVVVELSTE